MSANPSFVLPARRASHKLVLAALASAACLTAGSAPAFAQDKAAAESLFQAAKELMAQGKTADACPKFEASQRQDPSSGTLLNLARCHETLGRTASAWAEYKEAATLARTTNRLDQAQAASDLAKALEPKLSKLQIDAPALPGLEIKRNGNVVSTATLGVAIAVDPGEHTIDASAPGHKPFTTKVVIGNEHDFQTLKIPELEKLAEGAVANPDPAPTATPPAPNAAEAPKPSSSGTLRIASYVTAGVGVVGLGLGTVFGIMASGDASDAKSDPKLCPKSQCTPAGREKIDGAGTKALVSTIGIIGGGALLATGVVLFVVSSPTKSDAGTNATAQLIPTAGPDGGGLTLLGRF
jgi:hypothetical protein